MGLGRRCRLRCCLEGTSGALRPLTRPARRIQGVVHDRPASLPRRRSSSTASGCTPPAGDPGSTCSVKPATSRWRRDGPDEPDTVAAAREHPELVANTGIDEAVEHYAAIIAGLARTAGDHRPLVRRADRREAARPGHRRRRRCHRPGPDQGRAAAAARAAARRVPGARQPGEPAPGRVAHRPSSGTASATPSRRRSPTSCTSGGRSRRRREPLFQAAAANFALHSEAKVNTATRPRPAAADLRDQGPHRARRGDPVDFKQYRDSTAVTELRQFPERGHSLTMDSGWRDVADAVLDWLKAQD